MEYHDSTLTKLAPPPRVPGLPLLGSALHLRRDPLAHLVRLHRAHGAVFRMDAGPRRFTVLAGLEANRFLHKRGEKQLGSRALFSGMGRELGTDRFLVAMDGADHRHLRMQMRRAYSKAALEPHARRLVELVDEATRDWGRGTRVPILPFFRRLVTDQLGEVLTGRRPGETFESLSYLLDTLMRVTVMKTRPRLTLESRRYVRAKRRVFAFVQETLAERRAAGPRRHPDLIDANLALVDPSGAPLPEHAVVAATIGPYLAGMDTVAATLAFSLRGILAHPEHLDPVQRDAYALRSSPDLYGELDRFEHLRAGVRECMRLWPVAPFTPRVAKSDFEFGGHQVEAGADVLVANAVTHYLPEHFPDPLRYDPTRHLAPRLESRSATVFTPYGLGAHACLGAGLADAQMTITLGALFSRFELALEHPDKPLSVRATPLPFPGRRLALHVVRRR